MKKRKDKTQKKEDMPEFSFKEFNAEESAVYEEAIKKFRETLSTGKTLRQAFESYPIANPELSSLIQADFLKILIAERHFGQRQTLDEISKALDVSPDLLKDTLARMLQEVGVTAANQFGQEFGGVVPKAND